MMMRLYFECFRFQMQCTIAQVQITETAAKLPVLRDLKGKIFWLGNSFVWTMEGGLARKQFVPEKTVDPHTM